MMLSSHTMEPALSSLSLPDANIWLNVVTDAAYDRAQAGAVNTCKIHVSSYRDFAKFVSTTPKSLDPEHSNVVIHTDGTIGAVYFDFVFKIDGKAEKDQATGQSCRRLADSCDYLLFRSSRAAIATGNQIDVRCSIHNLNTI